MAYNYEYPYTDASRANADWLINEMKALEAKIDGIEKDILDAAKVYIDEQIAPFHEEIQALRVDYEAFRAEELQSQQRFEHEIRNQIALFDARLGRIRKELEAEILAVNARTDIAIQQNNEYIFEELSKGFSQLRVTNFFTGERVTIQQMLDYLATLHATNGLDYTTLAAKHNTYTQIASYGAQITALIMNGNSIIIQH